MKLIYLPVKFHIHFEIPVLADVYPPFVIRGILGNNLRKICCVAHSSECSKCMYNRTCAYSAIFETMINAENDVLPGTVRASHPFAITDSARLNPQSRVISDYDFTITLMGRAIGYLPYIYAAIARAGKKGMFKSRTPFEVTDVKVGEQSILLDTENICTDLAPQKFDSDSFNRCKRGEILVELITPFRFKVHGNYTKNFTAEDFFICLFRRMKNLCTMYGNCDTGVLENKEVEIIQSNVAWNDYTHYSGRQKTVMELGGVTGTFALKGTFSPMELAALEFNKLFNAGKNTVFGLGQINYWEKFEENP